MSSCYSSFLKFLRVLKNEESSIRVDILKQLGGHIDPPRRARYIDCNSGIVRIADDCILIENYLRAIALTILLSNNELDQMYFMTVI